MILEEPQGQLPVVPATEVPHINDFMCGSFKKIGTMRKTINRHRNFMRLIRVQGVAFRPIPKPGKILHEIGGGKVAAH